MKNINDGYHGCRMSKNAYHAYSRDLKPLSKFGREDVDNFNIFLKRHGIASVNLPMLTILLKKHGYEEKHHTGKDFRLTKFYSLRKTQDSLMDLCLCSVKDLERFERYLQGLDGRCNGEYSGEKRKSPNKYQYLVYRNRVALSNSSECHAVKVGNTICDINSLRIINENDINVYKTYYSKPKIMDKEKCDNAKKKIIEIVG